MKANVQISAVKKEFKNGQQGWQVFVEGMEGKLRCEMNFRDALRAIRYSFLLAKKLNLRINEVQLAALSLDYQQAKEAAKAQVTEAATEVAQEVAAEAEACDSASGIGACSDARAQAGSNEVQQGEPSDEKSEAAHEFVCCSKMQKFRQEHPDAVVIGRKENICSTFKDDAIACAEALGEAPVILYDGTPQYEFKIELLDKCIQKLVASGKKVCLWDIFKGDDDLEEFKAMVEAEIARNKQANSPLFKQFVSLKKNHPDALLLFRSGDVYKCYEEDAIKAAEVLCLTNIVEEDKITVASFPHYSLDTYLPRLIRAGHRIAICDQLEAPKPKKQAQMELFLRS